MSWLAILSAVKRFWWLGPIVAAGVLFMLWRGAEAKADREQAAHQQTIINYVATQALVTAQHKAQALEIEQRGREVTDEVTAQFRRDRDALRARYQRLLNNPASGSSASGSDLPGIPNPTGNTDAAPDLRLSESERLTAAEYTLQLEALQEWIRRQQSASEGE